MPFNGSGTFSRVYNWVVEQASSPIEIAKLDTDCDDIASGLSNCILRDGTGLPSTTIPWNSQSLTGVANLSAERVTVTSTTVPANGFYLPAANTVGFAANTTAVGSLTTAVMTMPAFAVTGATVPANGMYLSAANTVAWASNTTLRGSVNSTGNWTIAAPSSGTSVAVTAISAGGTAQSWSDGTVTGNLNFSGTVLAFGPTSAHSLTLNTNGSTRATITSAGNVTIAAPSSGDALTVTPVAGAYTFVGGKVRIGNDISATGGNIITLSTDPMIIGTSGAAATSLYTNGSARVAVASAGNVTINAPSSGVTQTLTATSGGVPLQMGDGTVTVQHIFTSSRYAFGTSSNHESRWYTNSVDRIQVNGSGNVTINAASSGTELTVTGEVAATTFIGALTGNVTGDVTGNVSGSSGSCTGNAATATTASACSGNSATATKSSVPRRTSGWSDGECLHVSAGQTLNTSDMAAGRTFSILNVSGSTITITQGAGVTMYWTSTGGTGTRTLAARGMATIRCESGTEAYISGNLS